MFVSNQVRSLDHATLGFKLNGIMKKVNWATGCNQQVEKKEPTITKYVINQIKF